MGLVFHTCSLQMTCFFFAKATMDQVELIENVFKRFCDSSGQKLSKQKSVVFFSCNIKTNFVDILGNRMGMKVTNDLGRYMGVPIIHGKIQRGTYAYILDKMKSRISDWACKRLSMASRLVLNQLVLSYIPAFTMQTVVLPETTCYEIDKVRRKFL